MKANSALLGREDGQKFTGRHDKYGPFSTEELDITELSNETYENIRDGPMSEMSPREVPNRDGDVDEEGDKETQSQVSSIDMPAERELNLIEYEVEDTDSPRTVADKMALKKENEELRKKYSEDRKKKFEEKKEKM